MNSWTVGILSLIVAMMVQQFSLAHAGPAAGVIIQGKSDTAKLRKAVSQGIGFDTYAHNAFNNDRLKLVLIKLLSRCKSDEPLLNASVILALKPFHLQRVASILREMKIENPVDSDVIDAVLMRVDAVDGLIRGFGHGGNIFDDILKKLIEKVEEDPVKVAQVILGVFLPMGKEPMLIVLHNLKELAKEWPTGSLQKVIEIIEKAMVNGGEMDKQIENKFGSADIKKDILDVLPQLAEGALDRLCQRETNLKAVEDQFINTVLPVLIAVAKKLANQTSEGATKVAELFVSLLRRLGSRAIETAINFVENHEDQIGERLHDFLIQHLQDALAEINFVRQFGLVKLVKQLNRGRQ